MIRIDGVAVNVLKFPTFFSFSIVLAVLATFVQNFRTFTVQERLSLYNKVSVMSVWERVCGVGRNFSKVIFGIPILRAHTLLAHNDYIIRMKNCGS